MYNCIKITLMQMINKGKRKFIIYPYGKVGHMTKDVLEELRAELVITVDDASDEADICGINKMDSNDYSDYVVILATQQEYLWREKKDNVKYYLPNNDIISMFNYDDLNIRRNILKRRGFDFEKKIYTLKNLTSGGGTNVSSNVEDRFYSRLDSTK